MCSQFNSHHTLKEDLSTPFQNQVLTVLLLYRKKAVNDNSDQDADSDYT